MTNCFARLGIAATVSMVATFGATAQADYPTEAITLVSPYGAGGNADLAARALAAVAPDYIGERVMVVNRTGAGGVTGSQSVIDGKKDGHTLLLARVGSQAVGPAINPSVPYDWDDFTIISMLETNPYVCVVPKSSPIEDFEDFTEALEGGSLMYATTGPADNTRVFPTVILQNLDLGENAATMLPYQGGGEQVAAVMGGHADFACNGVSPFANGLESGDLRALVVSTSERIPEATYAPTAEEVGMPNLELVSGWSALYGPPDLPQDVIDTWMSALEKINEDEEWLEMVRNRGSQAAIWGPERTTEFVRSQYQLFVDLAENLGD